MTGTVLILGANGGFGRAAAEAFWNAGWTVRRFDRSRDRLPEAATGADVIVNGWNTPYPTWQVELPKLTETVIEAARASGATILQPQNIYVYGSASPTRIGIDTPHAATNTLGRLRIDMERRLKASGVRVILLRAGDFIDAGPGGAWMNRVVLSRLGREQIVYPGNPDIPHSWAYLPDLGRAAVGLAERRAALGPFHEVLFPGYTLTGRDLATLASEALGRPLKVKKMNWLPIRFLSPVWALARHLIEMRYLWEMPHSLDGASLDEALPDFAATDPEAAIAAAIAGMSREAGTGSPVPASRDATQRA